MDRRHFFKISATGLAGLAFADRFNIVEACNRKGKDSSYSLVILGDTHYDKAPVELYHTDYSDPKPSREANHRKEIQRNIEMWADRCPKMLKRAGCLVDDSTKMCLQMGDMIQGDTGNYESHVRFLDDTFNMLKDALGPLPFITVAGNHDLRAADDNVAKRAYDDYMPARISKELGQEVTKTTFAFWIGPDAYIVIDFSRPDDEEIEKLLNETKKARYTFIISHGPLFPFDSSKYYYWFLYGKKPEQRLRFRKLFAQRNVISLCGHSHFTDFVDWYGDGGRITQLHMNSVWAKEEYAEYKELASTPEEYGNLRAMQPEAQALFDEVRPGLKAYSTSDAAGSYKLKVSDEGVYVDFYAGDSTRVSKTFKLR